MPISDQARGFIRELVVKSRELDAKLKELEAQAEAWPRIVATAQKNNIGAPAARALLEEVQTTKREIRATSAEIEENSAKLSSFLAGMRVQATEAVAEAKVREDFMAQYGWKDSMPMGPPDENWTLPPWAAKSSNEEVQDQKASIQSQEYADDLTPEETPAAASEFSTQQQNNRKQAPPTPVQPVSSRKAEPDSPSVFDIGLSDATIKMFVNKAKPQSAHHQALSPVSLPAKVISTAKTKASANQEISGQKSPVPPTISNFSAAYQEPEHNLTTDQDQDQDPGQDSTLGASPELQLRSALPSLQVNDSCLLPNMPDMSLSQSYAQKGEISPGLPCRTTPEPQEEVTTKAAPPCLSSSRMLHSANLDLSPELPELQTINLRDIINPRRVQRSDTPEVPELETVNLRPTSNKENVSQNQNLASSAKYESRDTPEAPELSNNYRGHNIREASNTPEAPKLFSKHTRALSESPETPVLQTINLRRSAK